MPVKVDFIEPGVYRASWIGNVRIEEPIAEMRRMMQMVTDQGDTSYVMIVDLTEMTQIPFDLNNLSRIARQDSRVTAYVVIRATKLAEVMGKMINQVTKRPFHFADSLSQGVEIARALHQKASQKTRE